MLKGQCPRLSMHGMRKHLLDSQPRALSHLRTTLPGSSRRASAQQPVRFCKAPAMFEYEFGKELSRAFAKSDAVSLAQSWIPMTCQGSSQDRQSMASPLCLVQSSRLHLVRHQVLRLQSSELELRKLKRTCSSLNLLPVCLSTHSVAATTQHFATGPVHGELTKLLRASGIQSRCGT